MVGCELKNTDMAVVPKKKTFRPRKRDWPHAVYKFWVRPLGELPEQLWTQARDMNQLWNELLELRQRAQQEAGALRGDEKKERWIRFNIDAKALVKASPINWECKSAVFDRFNAAARRTAKEHTDLRFRGGIRKINIPHRYTGGGMEIERLLSTASTAKRLRVRPIKSDAYTDSRRATTRQRLTRGVFGLANGIQFEFEIILHRPIPGGAIVKQASWCGIFDRNLPVHRRWSWALQLVCEVPPERYVTCLSPDTRGTCAIDLGWRVMGNSEYLRIGMLVDDSGRVFELRLPLYMGRRRDAEKKDYYSSFLDTLTLDEKIGAEVQVTKDAVQKLLDAKPAGFDKMRQRGLRNLIPEADGKLKNILEVWDATDKKLCAIKATVVGRMKRRKSWLYQNLAAWLTRSYKTIAWKGDLSFKELAQNTPTPALKHAAKYRQWAGLGELRTLIKNAAGHNCTELVASAADYNSVHCSHCGAASEGDRAKLWMECPNGHRWDQDINAARNLLFSQTTAHSEQNTYLQKRPNRESINEIEIPAVLKGVAVRSSTQ
jgi:hypothetical protein